MQMRHSQIVVNLCILMENPDLYISRFTILLHQAVSHQQNVVSGAATPLKCLKKCLHTSEWEGGQLARRHQIIMEILQNTHTHIERQPCLSYSYRERKHFDLTWSDVTSKKEARLERLDGFIGSESTAHVVHVKVQQQIQDESGVLSSVSSANLLWIGQGKWFGLLL